MPDSLEKSGKGKADTDSCRYMQLVGSPGPTQQERSGPALADQAITTTKQGEMITYWFLADGTRAIVLPSGAVRRQPGLRLGPPPSVN